MCTYNIPVVCLKDIPVGCTKDISVCYSVLRSEDIRLGAPNLMSSVHVHQTEMSLVHPTGMSLLFCCNVSIETLIFMSLIYPTEINFLGTPKLMSLALLAVANYQGH